MGNSTRYSALTQESVDLDAPIIGKKQQSSESVYELMSKSQFEDALSEYLDEWEIDVADLSETRDTLARFYSTYTSPNRALSSDALEHQRFSLLVNLYNLTSDSGHEPLENLGRQCADFIRHYRQVPIDQDLDEELERWEKEKEYKPNIVTRLPEHTEKAKLLDDLIQLDELLDEDLGDDTRAHDEKVLRLTARITSQDPEKVTTEDTDKLLERDKTKRYKRSVLPKDILDTFKKGTYGVVGIDAQKELQDDGWHICDDHERNAYRVFVDVNNKRFLQEDVIGEGDDLSLSLSVVTTENKHAFIGDPSLVREELFEDTAMFIIDTQGRMYLFSVDDHEYGLSHASVMGCEPVLFAGRVSTHGSFELHSSSPEYETNQRMSFLGTHHLTHQARIIDENSSVLSAPVINAEQARIAAKKPLLKTENTLKNIDQIELARAQPLNIRNHLAVNSENPLPRIKKAYAKHEGVYWDKRPDEIFPTGLSIPYEMLRLSESEQENIFSQNQNIKDYITQRFELPSANAVRQVSTTDFDTLINELRNPKNAQELLNSEDEEIILPENGITEKQSKTLTEYYFARQTATKLFSELPDKTVQRIFKKFKLNSPEGIWLLNEDHFDKLCKRLEKQFNHDTMTWLRSQHDLLELTLKPNTDPNRGIDIALDLHDQKALNIIPAAVITQIYDNMFEHVMKKGKVIKTAEEVKRNFEEKARDKNLSTEGLDAIWYLGGLSKFKHFLRTLINNKLLLTAKELDDFKARANLQGSAQKPAKFDELVNASNFPENAPANFEDDEFLAAKEAHALVHARKDALTQHYFSRRHNSDTPESNLEKFMYGSYYCKAKPHPWSGNRIFIYSMFILAAIIIMAALATMFLFAPQFMGLTASAANFAVKVFLGYTLSAILGGLSGTGTAYTVDKLIKPKPTEIEEDKFEYERWKFYQLPEEKLKESNDDEESILRESEMYI